MIEQPRSSCPINRSIELLGDRWSLLILRDITAKNHRSFRELLTGSEEGISAPLLSRRLADLTAHGFLTKQEAPRGKQGRYSLTELGIATVPLLIELSRLGTLIDPTTATHMPLESAELERRIQALRSEHLGTQD
ncbi:winged helix-turn-helix transcriptional regulator [Actinomyces faecalis]|uniref:winged helix-turn-helix transcriptional regulator n=1 Tax=Actinomyces faecalis TaxID=2722820 RepID=UPI001553E8B6|nr:helix-turn-helix domain-containing protein [Actinomyces faecalis]